MKITEYQLADLLITLENGGRPSGGVASITSGVPSVGGEHLTATGGFDFRNLRYVPEDYFYNMRRGHIQFEDILVVKDGATTGKTSFINADFPYKKAAVNEHVFILRVNKEKVLPKFLFYYLFSPSGQNKILANYRGAAIGGINQSFTHNTIVPVPPLPEQERIVRLLDEAEALRATRLRANARLEQFVPALFHEMFGDPSINDKNWPITNVGSVLTLCEYGTSQKANEDGVGITVLRMNNVSYSGELDLASLKHVELDEREYKKQLLQSGDVLFNRTNSRELVGKTGMWDGRFEAVAASYFIRVRFDPNHEHPQHFVTFMNLPFMKQKLAEMARGAVGQANINAQELQAIKLPIPPITLQREFAERVGEARAIQSAQGRSSERVEALYQSMLSRAFAGEL